MVAVPTQFTKKDPLITMYIITSKVAMACRLYCYRTSIASKNKHITVEQYWRSTDVASHVPA